VETVQEDSVVNAINKKENGMVRLGTGIGIVMWMLFVGVFAFAQEQADPEQGQVVLPDGQSMSMKTYIELMRTNLRRRKSRSSPSPWGSTRPGKGLLAHLQRLRARFLEAHRQGR
jgi:hypothetical protein